MTGYFTYIFIAIFKVTNDTLALIALVNVKLSITASAAAQFANKEVPYMNLWAYDLPCKRLSGAV